MLSSRLNRQSFACLATLTALSLLLSAPSAYAGPECEAGFTGGLEMQNWDSSGIQQGTTNIAPSTGPTGSATYSYHVDLGNPGPGVSPRTAIFFAPAPYSGAFSFDYDYSGFHATFQSTALLQVFVDGPINTEIFTLVNSDAGGGFQFTGSHTIDIQEGFNFGFVVGGSNNDSTSILQGDLTISNVNGDADSDMVADACDVCPGFDDAQDWDGDGIPDGCDDFQIPCPVDVAMHNIPDGVYNALNCEILENAFLGPVFQATFTNRGDTGAVLTNNGGMGGNNSTWINEADATIVNNTFTADGGGWLFSSALGNIINAGVIDNHGEIFEGRMQNSGTLNNTGVWRGYAFAHANSGDILNSSTGVVDIGRLDNQPGAMVDNAGTMMLGQTAGSTNDSDIENSGDFLSDLNDFTPADQSFDNTVNGVFTNHEGAEATFVGNVENRGLMTNEAGATMNASAGNGPFAVFGNGQLNNAGTLNGNGVIQVSGPDATLNNTGVINTEVFDLRVYDSATLNNEVGGTMNIESRLDMGIGSNSAPTLNNAGTLNVGSDDEFSGSLRISTGATLNNAATGVINVDDASNSLINGTVNNAGIIDLTQSVWFVQGSIINQAGAIIDVNEFGFVSSAGGEPSVENAGTVTISSFAGVNLEIFGTYTQTAGTTIVDSLLRIADVELQGGTLRGNGTIAATVGPVVNGGATVEPGGSVGTLTITGDYVQGENATLAVEIAGHQQGIEHDWLDVSGSANLAGHLQISFIDDFVPTAGDTFVVLTTAEVNTEFDSFSSTNVPQGHFAWIDHQATEVVVGVGEIGDCDLDDEISAFDYAPFQNCFTGLNGGPVTEYCECADFDEDGDVDFHDFGAFQRAVGSG